VDSTAAALERARRFASPMVSIPPVEHALPATRRLLAAAGAAFRIVGGIAVIHHGYLRTTEDIDVLITPEAQSRLDDELAAHGFVRESAHRIRHGETGVGVHLLVAGEPMPRPGAPAYPWPEALPASDADPTVVGLRGLIELKLRADRHQDRADLVALLQRLDEQQYLVIEAQLDAALRGTLAQLRRDALEEASWGGD
jgi:hypothetical protein